MTGYSVTVQDAEFTPSDRIAALEWQAEQDLRCDCGHPRDETMAPDGPDYNARAVRCRACEAFEATASTRAGVDEPNPNAGLKWRIEKARD